MFPMSLGDSSVDLCPLNSTSSDASFTSQVEGDSNEICRTSTPKKSNVVEGSVTAGCGDLHPNGEHHSKEFLSTESPDVSGTVNQSNADGQRAPSMSGDTEATNKLSVSGERMSESTAGNRTMQSCDNQDVEINDSGDAKKPQDSMLHSEQNNGTVHQNNNTSNICQNTNSQSDIVKSSEMTNRTISSPTNLNINEGHVGILCNNASSYNNAPGQDSDLSHASPPASVPVNGIVGNSDTPNTNDTVTSSNDALITNDTVTSSNDALITNDSLTSNNRYISSDSVTTNFEESNQSINSPTVIISSEETLGSKLSPPNNAVFQNRLTPEDRSYSTLSLTDSECLQLSDTDDNVSICSYEGRHGGFEKSSLPAWLEVGAPVIVGNTRRGIVKHIGNTAFKPGVWVGVALDDSVGKHNGVVQGVRYFTCKARKGIFVRPERVSQVVSSNASGR